jgi:Ca-activated chloride channel family protein
MTFIWPVMLLFLVLVPVFIILYLLMQRKRRRVLARSSGFGLLQGAAGRGIGIRRQIPPVLFLISLTILIVALARPMATLSFPRIEGTVILAFDASGSMAATDLKPTRMDAAKAAAKEFVQRQPPTVQIGVVSFSDGGSAIQAPTHEQTAILAAIDRLTPLRGTSLGQGIQASINAIALGTGKATPQPGTNIRPTLGPTPTPIPQEPSASSSTVIVLITDGENNEPPDPVAAAQDAAGRGIKINTIGIGTAAGINLHVNGFTVHTSLDEDMLKQVALFGNGNYYNAQTEQDLRKIYDNLAPQLVIKSEKTEVTSVFAGTSILILLIGGIFSLLWFGRLP